jgi:hypothetical protein
MKRSVVENCSPQKGYISAIAADIKRLHSAALLRDTAGRDSHARANLPPKVAGEKLFSPNVKMIWRFDGFML